MKKSALLIVALLLSAYVLPGQEPPFQFTHRGSILRMKFSPTGSMLLSYSSGNQDMALWDVRSGRLLWKRPISFIQKADEYYTLNSLAWSPDEKLVATGSANGTVQLWDVKTGKFLWRSEVHREDITAIRFSPDGRSIAVAALSDKAEPVKLIQVSDGKVIKTFEGNPCTGIAIAFDEKGRKLRIGNLDGNITEWDLLSAKQTGESATPCQEMRTYDWETSFSSDLTTSIRRTSESEILIKDNKTGNRTRTVKVSGYKINSRINRDGKKAVVSESAGFRFYDLETGENRPVNKEFSVATAFDLSDDGKLLAQEGKPLDTSIIVTDIESGRSWLLDGHPSSINAISYSPDNKILAVAGNDRNIYFFDPNDRTHLRTLSGHDDRVTAIAFSPDGKKLLSGDGDSVLKLWDTTSGELLDTVKAGDRSDDVERIEFANNSGMFLTLTNGSLHIWDISVLKTKIEIQTVEGYESRLGNMTTSYSSVPVNSAAFSIDGSKLVTGHSDGTIRLWNPDTGKELNKFKIGKGVSDVFPTPDGKKIAVIIHSDDNEKTIELIDIKTGEKLGTSKNIGITYLDKAAMSGDGRFIAVVGNIGTTEIWDLDDLSLVHKLKYEYSGDDSVAFSPNSKTFFIGGRNQNLSQYDTASGKRLWQLIPSAQPGEQELRLAAERKKSVAAITELKNEREKQAAIYVEKYSKKVYITFEHYGDMSDPGEKRMMESDELNESKSKKSAEDANAVWLRLHNDSSLPISIPTQSMYLPNPDCFHLFPDGQKMFGLCDNREISIWHGVKDKDNEWIPYGFDFGSSAMLLPNKSVLFPIPLQILKDGNSIVFNFTFQNIKASENDREWDYGEEIELRFNEQNLPKSSARP